MSSVTRPYRDQVADRSGQAVRRETERKREFRVGIMGASLHTGNRGVSALGASLARLVWQSRPQAEMSLLIGNRSADSTELRIDGITKVVKTVNYRLSPGAALAEQLWWIVLLSCVYRVVPWTRPRTWIARNNPWIRAVVEADFVGDIRGGDSFSDIYGAKEFLLGSLPVLSVILVRRHIHLLPQTYGPFRSKVAERVARSILLSAESIWCRDRTSLGEVSRLTGGKRAGSFCPDVAFALESVLPRTIFVAPALPAQHGGSLIGLNVSGMVYHGGYTRANKFRLKLDYRTFLTRLVERLLGPESNRVLLVPHTFAPDGRVESDPAACSDLMRSLSPGIRCRVHLVTREYDQHEIKGIIGMCDFFIGSRMHACIAALSQGIPTVGVAYSGKFAGVFDTVGGADWVIDGRTEGVDGAVERVCGLYEQREANRARLARTVHAAKDELINTFRLIMGGHTLRDQAES